MHVKLFLLLLNVLGYATAELMDDLIDAMLRNDLEIQKRVVQEDQQYHEGSSQPPLNIPWEAKKDKGSIGFVGDVQKTHNAPQYSPHGHPGYRGGKKRELVMKSIIERLLENEDENIVHNELQSAQQREMLDSVLSSITTHSKRRSSLKSHSTLERREKEAQSLINSVLTGESSGGYNGPKNIPWNKRDEKMKNVKNLTWKRGIIAPNFQWRQSKSALKSSSMKDGKSNLFQAKRLREEKEEVKDQGWMNRQAGNGRLRIYRKLLSDLKEMIGKEESMTKVIRKTTEDTPQ